MPKLYTHSLTHSSVERRRVAWILRGVMRYMISQILVGEPNRQTQRAPSRTMQCLVMCISSELYCGTCREVAQLIIERLAVPSSPTSWTT
ncbi:hypothetical protein QCA50_008633 [Cerrena zonata]|uniref:Uncharacterized protein n=1 Tax=Cerrena zonata TaxID=2478898 RepID=A0AAW0GE10_9APHY